MEFTTNIAGISPAKRQLVELMRNVRFGRIENLQVRNGDPVFDPPPTVRRLFVFGKPNGPRRTCRSKDFDLKEQVRDLFGVFDRVKTLNIQELRIDDGLPLSMSVTEKAGAK